MTSRDGVGRSRRALTSVVTGALAAAGLGVALTMTLTSGPALASACGPGGQLDRMPDGSRACVHADEAPRGVDLDRSVSTAALRARPGAGPEAFAAAEDAGVPSPVASTGTSPEVTCDGDGTSGYRVQALYVVEAGATNRYAALQSTLQNWAAGVDDVFNRSAALTGGVRHVRYVTTAGATPGTCVADVLNVTVPNGALADFNTSIQALQNAGFADPSRKYLMWTDTTGKGICGIATMYNDETPAQTNINNGSYPQYARIDSPCWGAGNGTFDHSVEAHELTHTLGGVQGNAPHSTRAGHCWDDADTMCYVDTSGHAMKQVCSADKEYLLDCNSDDYYSTFPDPGSYLDTHWDSASSRFLVGGGANGTPGSPTVLGARIAVNNPAVPGLSTQVSVTPSLPTGRTLASVAWKSARADCSFATPTAVQSTVTCNASATGSTTVTATLTDSTGATKVVSSPLTFARSTARPITATLTVAGQSGDQGTPASVCTAAPTPVSVTLTDTATGQPVKGLSATFTKQTASQTTAAVAGSAVSNASGVATLTSTATTAATFGAKTVAGSVYGAASPVTVPVTVGKCSPTLTASASSLDVYNGDPVTISGTLTRDVAGESVPVANAAMPVTVTSTTVVGSRAITRVTSLGAARTALDGSFALVAKPAVSGTLAIALPGSTPYTATSQTLGDLAVHQATSSIAASVNRSDVGYGTSLVVTGTLQRNAGGTLTGAPAQTVTAKLTAPGRAPVVMGTGRTAADGTFRIAAPVKASGALSVVYAGTSTLPAATDDLGDLTVGTWSTAVSATTSASSVLAGRPVTITGSVTRTYGDVTEPAKALPVKLYYQAAGAPVRSVLSAATSATGTFTIKVAPRATTTYEVEVVSVTGHADATSGQLTVTVP